MNKNIERIRGSRLKEEVQVSKKLATLYGVEEIQIIEALSEQQKKE